MKVSKEFKIGLLAIVSGAILYIGFNFLKGIDLFSNTNKYYAYYDNIDGLKISNPVTFNGFTVGRVSNIEIIRERNNKVEVELDINEDIGIGAKTSAELVTEILGGKSVVLHIMDGDPPIESGGTIIGTVEQSIFASFMDVTDPLKALAVKLSDLTTNFSKTQVKLDTLLKSLNQNSVGLQNYLDDNRRAIRNTMSNMDKITADLSNPETGLGPSLANLKTFSDSLKVMELNRTVDNMNKSLVSLNEVFEKMSKGDGTLGKLMNNDSLYNNLNKTAEDLDKLLVDLKENPKRYVQVSVFGKKDK